MISCLFVCTVDSELLLKFKEADMRKAAIARQKNPLKRQQSDKLTSLRHRTPDSLPERPQKPRRASFSEGSSSLDFSPSLGDDIVSPREEKKIQFREPSQNDRKEFGGAAYVSTVLAATDVNGLTPLHYAVMANNLNSALSLLFMGAKVDAKDIQGTSCLDMASDDLMRLILTEQLETQKIIVDYPIVVSRAEFSMNLVTDLKDRLDDAHSKNLAREKKALKVSYPLIVIYACMQCLLSVHSDTVLVSASLLTTGCAGVATHNVWYTAKSGKADSCRCSSWLQFECDGG